MPFLKALKLIILLTVVAIAANTIFLMMGLLV